MPKISVIIPVYKAELTLRRCVESIVFGEEKDLEVILVEDRSSDGSWALCQKLAEEYPQVVCLQNDRNRGVSYTRNRGLDAATGQFVLFVDSDDWVSGSYVKILITAALENPGKLIACGFTFIDHTQSRRCDYVITDTEVLPRQEFHRLSETVLLQQLWNKVFCLAEIRNAGIRFDETISMGEDYKFVMDVIEAMDYRECVIIPKPLYYYIRWGNGSLMDQWSKYETYRDALNRAMRVERLCGRELTNPEQFQKEYAYRIMWETSLPQKQKYAMVVEILGRKQGNRYYLLEQLRSLRRLGRKAFSFLRYCLKKLSGKCGAILNRIKIRKAVNAFREQELVIISQNCIGAVFTHDMGQLFRTPTVNLFFSAGDFIKFVKNLEHYLAAELKMRWVEEYPVGMLDDIHIHFLHYEHCRQAMEAWERRKTRVDLSKVFVLSTDRDGFNEALFEQWKTIPYPKLLFTASEQYASDEDVLYFPKYRKLGSVPDLIEKREFYKDNVLIDKINAM